MSTPHSPMKKHEERGMMATPRILLKTFGAIPMEFKNKRHGFLSSIMFWFYVVCTSFLFFANAVSTYQKIVERDMSGFFQSLSYTTVVADCMTKFTLYRGPLVKEICPRIDLHEKEIRSQPEHNRLYNKRLIFLQRLIKVLLPAASLVLIHLVSRPLYATIEKEDGTIGRRLVTAYWYPIDPDEHYAAAYTTEVFIMTTTSQCILFTDVLLCSVIYSCICQFEVIHYRLKNIHQDSVKMAKEKMIPLHQAQVAVTRGIAISHQKMIALVKDIDKALGFYLFLQFLMSSSRVALTIFNAFWSSMSLMEQAGEYLYVFALSVEVAFYYFIANEVTLCSSDGMYNAVAISDYHELCPSSRKMLVTILCAAKTPLTLSIGPFDVLSLNTLLKIVKSGYYALSILNNFQVRQE